MGLRIFENLQNHDFRMKYRTKLIWPTFELVTWISSEVTHHWTGKRLQHFIHVKLSETSLWRLSSILLNYIHFQLFQVRDDSDIIINQSSERNRESEKSYEGNSLTFNFKFLFQTWKFTFYYCVTRVMQESIVMSPIDFIQPENQRLQQNHSRSY